MAARCLDAAPDARTPRADGRLCPAARATPGRALALRTSQRPGAIRSARSPQPHAQRSGLAPGLRPTCNSSCPTSNPRGLCRGRGSHSFEICSCFALKSLRNTSPNMKQALGRASGLAASPALWRIFHERGSDGHGLVGCWGSSGSDRVAGW